MLADPPSLASNQRLHPPQLHRPRTMLNHAVSFLLPPAKTKLTVMETLDNVLWVHFKAQNAYRIDITTDRVFVLTPRRMPMRIRWAIHHALLRTPPLFVAPSNDPHRDEIHAHLVLHELLPLPHDILDREPTPEEVVGRHVYGELPLHLAALTHLYTHVPFRPPKGDAAQDIADVNAWFGPLRTYVIDDTTPE